jgi:hypothetical protein
MAPANQVVFPSFWAGGPEGVWPARVPQVPCLHVGNCPPLARPAFGKLLALDDAAQREQWRVTSGGWLSLFLICSS